MNGGQYYISILNFKAMLNRLNNKNIMSGLWFTKKKNNKNNPIIY